MRTETIGSDNCSCSVKIRFESDGYGGEDIVGVEVSRHCKVSSHTHTDMSYEGPYGYGRQDR
ncbi:hypothetical protein SEA_GUEY18_6 [Gordonia phage Guey18]|nr:hypothetical protein SEA_GUEY18_6 [Gordonia phage Guey18]